MEHEWQIYLEGFASCDHGEEFVAVVADVVWTIFRTNKVEAADEVRKLEFELNAVLDLPLHPFLWNRSRCTVNDLEAEGKLVKLAGFFELDLLLFEFFGNEAHLGEMV